MVEDEIPQWIVRERVLIDKMEQYLAKSESNQVEVTELEYYSLEPEDADICIELFAEGARDNVVITNSYCSTLEEEGEALRVADAVR